MAKINTEYVDLWIWCRHIETGNPQYHESLNQAVNAWYRYLYSQYDKMTELVSPGIYQHFKSGQRR